MVHPGTEGRQTSLSIEGRKDKESLTVSHILYTSQQPGIQSSGHQ